MERAELHLHLLPGIDDWPIAFDEAVARARLAVEGGMSLVTAAPRVHDLLGRGIVGDLPERVAELVGALTRA